MPFLQARLGITPRAQPVLSVRSCWDGQPEGEAAPSEGGCWERGCGRCGGHSPLSAHPSCYADVPGRVCALDKLAGTAGSVLSPVPVALSLPHAHLSQVRSEPSVG